MPNTALTISIELWQIIIFALICSTVLYTIGVAAATLFIKNMKTKKEDDKIKLNIYTKISMIEDRLTELGVVHMKKSEFYSEKKKEDDL